MWIRQRVVRTSLGGWVAFHFGIFASFFLATRVVRHNNLAVLSRSSLFLVLAKIRRKVGFLID